ncbi:MAG: hypothetical protein J6M05_06505 [Cardiobacteriaceae bacterium]|nr:hypothetical protein [Cardiobacteriaceae bacterium]
MVTVKNILVKFYSGNKTASQTDIILKHIDNIQVIFDEENLFEYCQNTLSIIKTRVENNDFYESSKNNDLFTLSCQLARALDGYGYILDEVSLLCDELYSRFSSK